MVKSHNLFLVTYVQYEEENNYFKKGRKQKVDLDLCLLVMIIQQI